VGAHAHRNGLGPALRAIGCERTDSKHAALYHAGQTIYSEVQVSPIDIKASRSNAWVQVLLAGIRALGSNAGEAVRSMAFAGRGDVYGFAMASQIWLPCDRP
jgi:hypothetical protein